MTRTELKELLDLWKKRLGLDNWRIALAFEKCEDDSSYMEVFRNSDYQRAKIIVPPWILGEESAPETILVKPDEVSENFVEESLVHELLHLVVTPMTVIIREDIFSFLHRDVHSQVENSQRHAEEKVVDNLSVSLVRAFHSGGNK